MLKEGTILGKRYEILGRVGSGGMADVYKGKDHKLNRFVAIKVLKSDYRNDEVFIKKFLSEAQAAAGLMHPNVVNVYDVGQDRGLYYMVMELVEGITLKEYIQKKGELSAKETISISIQMVLGIQAAHNQHIIHRDIKPQNIIISKDGKVKVTDFGIARATTSTNTISTSVMGSVHYTSPEQAKGGIVDEKSDIYSAGITMYEMITGHVPFDGDSTVSVAIKHLQEEIPSPAESVPDIPYSLECIIMKCTQKNPAMRYQNCQELINDLKRSLVDPDGDFVNICAPRADRGDETVVMSDADRRRLQSQSYHGNDGYGDEEGDYDPDDEDYDPDEDEDYDPEDDYEDDRYPRRSGQGRKTGVDPNTKKIMKILTIVAAVIIAFVMLIIVAQTAGVFKNISKGNGTQSSTEQKVTVPDLKGMTEEQAKAALSKKNLGYNVSAQKASDQYAKGTIMDQDVAANKKVAKNTTINVTLSTGPEIKKVTIPDLTGMSQDDAESQLKDMGLVVSSDFKYDDNMESGKVISMDPSPGASVDEGTTVTIYVSKGADKITVPDVRGMSQSDAQAALESAGLTLGSVSSDYNNTYTEGLVCGQSQSANSKVSKGTSVDLVISKGQKPTMVDVPSLTGKTLDEATQALTTVGLSVGNITYESDSQAADTVVSQSASAGSQLEEGSTVDLVVSQGQQDQTSQNP